MGSTDLPKISDDRIEAFQQGEASGRAEVYCECVRTGAKLAARIMVRKAILPFVVKTISANEVRYKIEPITDEMALVWIYKYQFVETLIAEISQREDGAQSLASAWVFGKLFGYSDYEIACYLKEQDYITRAL